MAPVMGDQEHLGGPEPGQLQDSFLGFPVDIPGEEEGDALVAEVKDEREFVVIGVGIDLVSATGIKRWVEYRGFQTLDQTGRRKRPRIEDWYSSVGQCLHEAEEVGILAGDTRIPELFDRELGGDEGEAAEVVRVGVTEDHGLKVVNPPMPEVRRHDIAAHVERGARKAAAVNEHGTPIRELHDCGVALAHIEKGNPKRRKGEG
jgi:hypothetical protein